MDLRIGGRKAIVCASSQGLGRACGESLAAEGVHVFINGRDADKLEVAAAEIREKTGGEVTPVAADLVTPAGRQALLDACPEPDILVTNNRGPRPGGLDEADDDAVEEALDLHFRAPLALLRAVVPGMRERKWGRIINITSAMVTRPAAFMPVSAGVRAGLTGLMKSVSNLSVADNVTINNLLPERIDSPRQHEMALRVMERQGVTYEEARQEQVDSIAAGRLGKPEELGATCAFLCSEQASFISGMNMHLDGGSYPGLV